MEPLVTVPRDLISKSIPTVPHRNDPTAISMHKPVSLQRRPRTILGHYGASCYMEQKVQNQSG